MDIRGASIDQIQAAIEEVNKSYYGYHGNLELRETSVSVPRKPEDVEIKTSTYTVPAEYRVFVRHYFGQTDYLEDWRDYGFTPYRYDHRDIMNESERLASERVLCEEKISQLETSGSIYGDNVDEEYEVRLVPEHDRVSEWKIDSDYVTMAAEPLNKRGDAFKVRLGVKSSRRPGSRVSPERHYFGGDSTPARRVTSPCWHANRDFMRCIFELAPDARIRTALTNTDDFAELSEYYGYGRKRQYTGTDHFEEMYQTTDGNIGSQMAPFQHSDACNCDEGAYPEFATDGLSEEQYKNRFDEMAYMARDAGIDTSGKRWRNLASAGDLTKMLSKIHRPTISYLRPEEVSA